MLVSRFGCGFWSEPDLSKSGSVPQKQKLIPVNRPGKLSCPVVTGSFEKQAPGARFSKDPVTTGPDNLPGRLTGNFTGPGIAFLEAPVNFPDTYRSR